MVENLSVCRKFASIFIYRRWITKKLFWLFCTFHQKCCYFETRYFCIFLSNSDCSFSRTDLALKLFWTIWMNFVWTGDLKSWMQIERDFRYQAIFRFSRMNVTTYLRQSNNSKTLSLFKIWLTWDLVSDISCCVTNASRPFFQ